GRNGFFDIQAAQRWIASPRPNETPIDLTAGLWLNKRWMVMLQSFNIVSAGDAKPPYTYYRSRKLELSLVQKLSRHWALQVGAFYSPAGQNALVERAGPFGLAFSPPMIPPRACCLPASAAVTACHSIICSHTASTRHAPGMVPP